MDQKRLLLAALLSLIVLFGWQALMPPPEPESGSELQSATADNAGTELAAQDPSPQPRAGEPAAAAGDAEGGEGLSPAASQPPATATAFTPISGDRPQVVVLGNGSHRVEFSNRGGVLEHYVLLDRLEAGGGDLDLVRRREGGLMDFALVDEVGEPLAVNEGLFAVEKGTDWVRFSYAEAGIAVDKRWQLLGDGQIKFELTVRGLDNWGWHLGPGVRNPPLDEAGSRLMHRNAVYLEAGEVETVAAGKANEPLAIDAAGAAWFGLEDNYFLTVAIPETMAGEVRFVPFRSTAEPGGTGTWVAPGPVFDNAADSLTEWGMWVYPAGESWSGRLYLGAKEMDELATVAPRLDDTVHTGMLRILARPLHTALLWIHDHVVANYGWSIVLLTGLVRILLFPLTHKSAVSMRKMQALNPKIQGIRSKYRPKLKDKQGRPNADMQRKMNEEVMALYKSEGVNPAGGCLPMLLQLPVFIAFYTMLPVAVELRNAPWLLWIQDLSMPDPYYVLPIVMGASQLLFQRLMPSTGDKMQRRIMMLMPIFFTFLFLKFAAGLVLYWLTSNLLGIGQQLITNRLLGPPEAVPAK